MASGKLADPATVMLVATIAQRYYLHGASKSEIASELGLSRFKVARLLEQAREDGLVRIEIDYRGEVDLELSFELRRLYGLNHALVIESPQDDQRLLRANLGRAAAGLLSEIVGADDVLGLVWGQSVGAMRDSLARLAPCTVVQLTGALSPPGSDEGSVELVRDVARVSGGPAFCFYAPMIVPDASTASTLRTQPEIARALSTCSKVTKAVVGVGAWAPGLSTVADSLTSPERQELADLGVRAEVAGIGLGQDGEVLQTPLSERRIGIEPDDLKAVREVIAVTYGSAKTDAVRAAHRAGLISSIVTHREMAESLLSRAEGPLPSS